MTAERRPIPHPVKVLVVVFILLGSAWALTAAPVDIAQLLQAIRGEMQPSQAMDFMQHVYSTDRWFTFPKFQETAEYLKHSMEEIGLEDVELLGAPADGSSHAGFWMMPLAWDVKSGRLEIIDPVPAGEPALLGDYS